MSSYAAARRTVSADSGSSAAGGPFVTCQYVVASAVGVPSAGVARVIRTSCASMIRW